MGKCVIIEDRDFLSEKKSRNAFISTGIEVSYGDNTDHLYVDTRFTISDCSRVINLDFDFGDEEEFKKALDKIELVGQYVSRFKQGLIKAKEKHDEIMSEIKERNNDKKAEN